MQQSKTLFEDQVQRRICVILEELLGIHVGPQQPLMEAGLDSLGAMELHERLCATFKCELPATIAFDFPSTMGFGKVHCQPIECARSYSLGTTIPRVRNKLLCNALSHLQLHSPCWLRQMSLLASAVSEDGHVSIGSSISLGQHKFPHFADWISRLKPKAPTIPPMSWA